MKQLFVLLIIVGLVYGFDQPTNYDLVCNVLSSRDTCSSMTNKKITCPNLSSCLSVGTSYQVQSIKIRFLDSSYDQTACMTNTVQGSFQTITIESSPNVDSQFDCESSSFLIYQADNERVNINIANLGITRSYEGNTAAIDVRSTFQSKLTLESVMIEGSRTSYNAGGGAVFASGFWVLVNNSNIYDSVHPLNGGAIYSTEQIQVIGSTFTSNNANYGGALYAPEVSVSESQFTSNSAFYGGAIASNLTMVNMTTFSSNSGSMFGGAIYSVQQGSYLNIVGSEFISNSASYGGAIYINIASVFPLVSSLTTFNGNSASNDGGAIYYLCHGDQDCNVNVTGSVFNDNVGQSTAISYRPYNTNLIGGVFYYSAGYSPFPFGLDQLSSDMWNTVQVQSSYSCPSQFPATQIANNVWMCSFVKSSCYNGMAYVNNDGYVYDCDCNEGYSGESCSDRSDFWYQGNYLFSIIGPSVLGGVIIILYFGLVIKNGFFGKL